MTEPMFLAERILELFQTSWNWAETAPKVLATLGQDLPADRAFLLAVGQTPGTGFAEHCVEDWSPVPGRPSLIGDGEADRVEPVEERLTQARIDRCRSGETFHVATHEADPELARILRAADLSHALVTPVFVSGHWWGSLVVGRNEQGPAFTPVEVSLVRIAGRLFGDAVEMSASAVAASETVRRAIMDAAADGVVVMDGSGSVVDGNLAALTLLGIDRSGLALCDMTGILRTADGNPVLRRRAGAVVETAVPLGQPIEARMQRPNGDVVVAEITLQELWIAERRILAANLRDLTRERAAEEEIRVQRERLHAAMKDAALGSLLAGVAHELNNPLAVVIAQTTLLETKVNGTPFAERVGKIRTAADRCNRIIKGFLAMAKRSTPNRRLVDLNECVRAAIDMTAYGTKAAGIALEFRPAGIPFDVLIDPDLISQVVANLIVNAQHAMAAMPDPRRVRIVTERSDAGARIVVEDNGPGVPEAFRERVFEAYFTTKPVGAGTGIGLSVGRSIALAHGGNLVHEVGAMGGARFVLTLPLPEASAAVAEHTGSHRVLIVDDEPDVAASLAEILELLGAEPVIAATVQEALAAASDATFDAIFSDLRMPGGGGIALLQAVMTLFPTNRPRLVLVTGDTVSAGGEVAAAGLADAVGLIEKPFTVAEIRRVWSPAKAVGA